ncbi:MAG: zinc ribbon domain-containing protein [Candidatus Hodarchaeota archaeon]
MSSKKPTEPICQSCALSIQTVEDKGTEADGTRSDDYCCDCYEAGEFIEPEITIKEMIEMSVTTTAKSLEITLDEARIYLESLLPTLKRWQ